MLPVIVRPKSFRAALGRRVGGRDDAWVACTAAVARAFFAALALLASSRYSCALCAPGAPTRAGPSGGGVAGCRAGGASDPDSSLVSLTFQPGSCGIELEEATGKVVVVAPGGQAERLGVKAGWYLRSIDGRRYAMDVVRIAIGGSAPYVAVYQPFIVISSAGSPGAPSDTDPGTAAPERGLADRVAQALNMRGMSDWERDVQTVSAQRSPGVDVREATSLQDVQGASKVLADSNAAEGEEAGFLDALVPFAGLTYMRLLSTVSLSSPLTVVAVAGSDVVGMAEVKVDGYVRNLAVRDDWKRRGIGSRLLCWCAESSRQRGAERLWLHVRVDNEEGLGLYKRLNFTFELKEPMGPENQTMWRLSRTL